MQRLLPQGKLHALQAEMNGDVLHGEVMEKEASASKDERVKDHFVQIMSDKGLILSSLETLRSGDPRVLVDFEALARTDPKTVARMLRSVVGALRSGNQAIDEFVQYQYGEKGCKRL